jgi:signal transduction histidine kinase
LRQDLHDGLGPALTGIGFRTDAVMNLAEDPARSLVAEIRAIVDTAIADVRRLINQLHPSALDDVGLASGLSITAMAAWLGLTPKTVNNNLSTVFGTLGVADWSEVALFARGALRRGRGPGGFGG